LEPGLIAIQTPPSASRPTAPTPAKDQPASSGRRGWSGRRTTRRSASWSSGRSRRRAGGAAQAAAAGGPAAGYDGLARNLRLVAHEKTSWGPANARTCRPAVCAPGEVLGGLHVFCVVLAFSRVRFVRFGDNERAETTLALLAECFEVLGGVPKVVLADRMGCLKGGVVADVVLPTPDYVHFAAHYRFRPDFCRAADPASKGSWRTRSATPGPIR
jgi:Integrase core domain